MPILLQNRIFKQLDFRFLFHDCGIINCHEYKHDESQTSKIISLKGENLNIGSINIGCPLLLMKRCL